MIRSVDFSSKNVFAGDQIVLTIDAAYPIIIEINCFVTQPPPPRYVPCPQSGTHIVSRREPFYFSTHASTFRKDGHIEFKITDADNDTEVHRIEVENTDNEPQSSPSY